MNVKDGEVYRYVDQQLLEEGHGMGEDTEDAQDPHTLVYQEGTKIQDKYFIVGVYAKDDQSSTTFAAFELERSESYYAFSILKRSFGDSLSAVWTATIVRKDAFCSVSENL